LLQFAKDNKQLEIWGKAQRESARRPKSDWGENSGGGEIPSSKISWPEIKCISIRRMRTVDLGLVNTSHMISGDSGPKFT